MIFRDLSNSCSLVIAVLHVLPCLQTQHKMSTVYATKESAYLEAHADLDLLHKEIVIYVTV